MLKPLVPIASPKRPSLPVGAQLLAADVGGTKVAVALFEIRDEMPAIIRESVYPSKQYGSLAEVIRHFQDETPLPERLSIAFAGPVQQGKAKATNLDWTVDIESLRTVLNIQQVSLLNDLEAAAYGLAALSKNDLLTIYPGKNRSGEDLEAPTGNSAIIAPGTGLGEAGLIQADGVLYPFATEGGHADFAPRTAFDWEFLLYLQQQFGHVSWERAVSGPGIHHIYGFLRDVKHWNEPARMIELLKGHEPAAAIALGAQEGIPVCKGTLQLFVRYLAIESSNLALKMKATRGIFIGGGVAPNIWDETLQAVFLEHFFQVGRLRPLIESMPVYLVLNQKLALLGAAWYGFG